MKKRRTKINYDLLSPVKIYQLVLTGKLKKFPNGFWSNSNGIEYAIEISRYLFESILQWSSEDIKKHYSFHIFVKNKLAGLLNIVFKGSPFEALNAAYPNQFKVWELNNTPMNFWNEETGVQATKWLIEEKLKWTENDIKEKLLHKTFVENGLGGMLETLYHYCPWRAINAAYPYQFKEWELKKTLMHFWNQENGILTTKWLIEEKLKWTENDIKEKLNLKVFSDNGLGGMLAIVYHDSAWQAINAAYPDRFKEWELKNVPRNFWNKETGIQATKWLIEEKLKWADCEIKEHLRLQTFYDHGVSTIMRKFYNNNIYKAIDAAYLDRFKESDFKGRSKIFPKLKPESFMVSIPEDY